FLVHHPHVPTVQGGGRRVEGGRPCLARLAQGPNRRAALVRGDEHFCPTGSVLLEPGQQPIVGDQLIDAAATLLTAAEVGGDLGEFPLGELAQGQRTQPFVARMVQRGLGHDKPVWVHRTAKRPRRSQQRNVNGWKTLPLPKRWRVEGGGWRVNKD